MNNSRFQTVVGILLICILFSAIDQTPSFAQFSPQCTVPPNDVWVNRVAHRPPGGAQYILVNLENDYLVGVLEGEIGPISAIPNWDSNALQAGSIAIRTWSSYWCRKHVFTNTPYGTIKGLYDTTNPPYYDQEYWPGHSGDTPRYIQQVAATQGIYTSHSNTLIDAQYRARNGDPTNPQENPFTRTNYPYLRSVRDPVSASETRSQSDGQSVGLAQNGTHYWASGTDPTPDDERHPRWNSAAQIVAHYYSEVDLRTTTNSQLYGAYRWNALQINYAPTAPVAPGSTHHMTVWAQNTGTTAWYDGSGLEPQHALSYRIYQNGQCVANCNGSRRWPLNNDLDPGDDKWFYSADVFFPSTLQQGLVAVRFDVVQLVNLLAQGQEQEANGTETALPIQPSATNASVDFWFSDQGWFSQDLDVCVGGCNFLTLIKR